MKIRKTDGFVMIQVLVLILVILMFLTALFSTTVFRHKRTMMYLQKEEARYAAEAALRLMENGIADGSAGWIETGLKRTETTLEFQSEDGETKISIPVILQAEYKDDQLYLYAEAKVGTNSKNMLSVLELLEKQKLMTDSNSQIATSSTAEKLGGKGQDAE